MFLRIFLYFIILLTVFSCVRKKDFENDLVKYDDLTPQWKLPLVNSTLSIKDAFDNETADRFFVIENGLITFVHRDSIETPLGENLFDEFKFPKSFMFRSGVSVGKVDVSLPANQTVNLPEVTGSIPFKIDSVEAINEVVFKSGLLNVLSSSSYRHKISFTLTMPDLKSGTGTAFTQRLNLDYVQGRDTTKSSSGNINLSGFVLKSATGEKNKISYRLSDIAVTLVGDNNSPIANPILATDSIKFDISISDVKYKLVKGRFSNLHIKSDVLTDSVTIAPFQNAVSADVRFVNPSLEFDFRNSFGIVPSVYIDKAEMGYAGRGSAEFNATAPSMKIPGETILKAGTVIGQPEFTHVLINSSTSNLASLLTTAPNKFSYRIPSIRLSASTTEDAFISDDSRIKIYSTVKLPLHGAINQLTITDTRAAELPESENIDFVEFKIRTENSIPAGVDIQVYFQDSLQKTILQDKSVKYAVIDSLITGDDAVVGPAAVKSNEPFETEQTAFEKTFRMSKERYDKVARANTITVKGTLRTTEAQAGQNVRFTYEQTLKFRLSCFAQLRLKLKD